MHPHFKQIYVDEDISKINYENFLLHLKLDFILFNKKPSESLNTQLKKLKQLKENCVPKGANHSKNLKELLIEEKNKLLQIEKELINEKKNDEIQVEIDNLKKKMSELNKNNIKNINMYPLFIIT